MLEGCRVLGLDQDLIRPMVGKYGTEERLSRYRLVLCCWLVKMNGAGDCVLLMVPQN